MRTLIALAAVGAFAASALALPSAALASGSGCRNTGTAVGAVAGGLLGNGVSRGGGRTGGTIIGALGGAVVGHEIAKRNCDNDPPPNCRWTTYRDHGRSHRVEECRGRDGYWHRR